MSDPFAEARNPRRSVPDCLMWLNLARQRGVADVRSARGRTWLVDVVDPWGPTIRPPTAAYMAGRHLARLAPEESVLAVLKLCAGIVRPEADRREIMSWSEAWIVLQSIA